MRKFFIGTIFIFIGFIISFIPFNSSDKKEIPIFKNGEIVIIKLTNQKCIVLNNNDDNFEKSKIKVRVPLTDGTFKTMNFRQFELESFDK